MINNWLHDFASGTWAACILVIWLLRGRMPHVPQAAAVALAGVGMLLFWLALGAVAGTVWAWYLVYSANAAYTGLPVK